MQSLAFILTTVLLGANASACPVSTALVERYGIGDGGFLSPPPLATSRAPASLFKIALPKSNLVSDGFAHTVFVDRGANRAWILRTGGLAQVREWYGPVEVSADSLDGCGEGTGMRPEQLLVVMQKTGDAAGRHREARTP